MEDREHIISLGRVLAAEHRRGCDDSATDEGLEVFLAAWRAGARGALAVPAVRATLTLLADYGAQSMLERRARVGQALTELRALFRAAPANGSASRADDDAGHDDQAPEARAVPQAAAKPPRVSTKAPRASAKPAPRAASPVEAPAQPALLPDAPAEAPAPKAAVKVPKAPAAPAKSIAALAPTDPVELVPGLNRADINAFKRLGMRTCADVLYHFPHRYDDFSSQKGIADLVVGTVATVVAEVGDARLVGGGGRSRVEVTLNDHSGTIKAVYFNQPWLTKQLTPGRLITVSGKVSAFNGLRQLTSPTWEPYAPDGDTVHTGRLVPVHPLTKGLHERNARKTIKLLVDALAPRLPEYLPEASRARRGLLPLGQALAQIHFPDDRAQLERARQRLGFDEFLFIQLGVVQRKLLWQGELGYQIPLNEELHGQFQGVLPFSLTGAQQRALGEIFADMDRPIPMARLLQGDVGSGKTAVAAAALVQAIGQGFQGALMAPTEILAEQHYKGLKQLLAKVPVPRAAKEAAEGERWQDRLDAEEAARLAEIKALLGMTAEEDMGGQGVRVALLTGSLGAKERRRVLEGIAKGEVDLVVGTHALITDNVQFASLGLVVVDEQHRFGVEQRQRLRNKGFNPHMLVMTATPIPRTLTMTIYGDLDTSVLDELPPGRQPIRTKWVKKAEREKAYRHMRREIEKGRQAFVICPLVEESEKVDLPSAEEMYEKLQGEVFPDLRVALLHGRMLPREKDEVMVAFRDHTYDILVSTAVIEVGIDVPNASTIVIDGAERFGLAQLHQFRGRVGRGQHQSYCILVSDKDDNEVTKQRLGAMEQTTDGFKLAEIDLQLRGPGEFFGTRQSGTPDLKVAQLADTRLLHAARSEAEIILKDDPQLARPEHALLKQKVDAFWAEAVKAG